MKQDNALRVEMCVAGAKRHFGKGISAMLILILLGCAPPKPITIKHQVTPSQGSAAVSRTENPREVTQDAADGSTAALVDLLKKKNYISADEADRFLKQHGPKTAKEKGAASSSEDIAALVDLLKSKNVIGADEATRIVKPYGTPAAPELITAPASEIKDKKQIEKIPTAVAVEPKKDTSEPVKSQVHEEKSTEIAKSENEGPAKIAPVAPAEMKKDIPEPVGIIVVGNSDTKRYHLPGMPYYNKVAKHHRVLFESEQQAIENGYYKSGTTKGAGVPKKSGKESIIKPNAATEQKKDLSAPVENDEKKDVPQDAVKSSKEKSEKAPVVITEGMKKDIQEQVKVQVREELARMDKVRIEKIPAAAKEEVKPGLETPVNDDAKKDASHEATTKIDDEQVDEIKDGVKEELKSDISEQVYKQVKERVRAEIPDELKKTDLTQYLPDWMKRMRLSADARLRYEHVSFDKQNYNEFTVLSQGTDTGVLQNTWADTDAFKYRVRFGLESINPYFDGVIRLSTGNTTNPISTNAVFGDYLNKDNVVFDLAYVKIKPWDFISIYGGRMPNLWFCTNLVWAADLNFEGLALTVKKPIGPSLTPFLTIGAFPLQQSGATSTLDFSQHNKWLYGAQTGLEIKKDKGISAQVGAAYYYFNNITGELNQTLSAGATDWSSPLYNQRGNTIFYIDPQYSKKFGLASEFKEVNITGALDIGFWDPVHIILTGDYVRNIGFNKGDVAARTGLAEPEEWINGYNIGVSVGYPKVREFGQWKASLFYKFVGRDAVVDAFTDSDFNLGTNAKGWILGAELGLTKNLWLGARWISTNEITGPPLAVDLFQLDLNVSF